MTASCDKPTSLAASRGSAALAGSRAVREPVSVALDALAEGVVQRGGPIPVGGPDAVEATVARLGVVPTGAAAVTALAELTKVLAAGSADPADVWCAAHLHCPSLAVAAAADLIACAINPSMDSWDQAPAASVIERRLTDEVSRTARQQVPVVTGQR